MTRILSMTLTLMCTVAACCPGPHGGSTTLQFNHFQAPAHGMMYFLATQYRRSSSGEWSPFYETIHGYQFAWGHVVEVEATETYVGQRMVDGPEYEYTVTRVVSDTVVAPGTEFTLTFDPEAMRRDGTTVFALKDDGTALLGDHPVVFGEARCREEVRSASAGSATFDVTFRYADTPEAPFIVCPAATDPVL